MEEVQARERSSARTAHEAWRPRDYLTGATLFADTTSPRYFSCQQGHSSQDCPTVAGIESRRESERSVGATFVLGEDTFRGLAVAESSASVAREGIMLPSAPTSLDRDQKSPNLALDQRPHLLSPLKHHPTVRHRAAPCALTRTSMSFFGQHRLLRSTRTPLEDENGSARDRHAVSSPISQIR